MLVSTRTQDPTQGGRETWSLPQARTQRIGDGSVRSSLGVLTKVGKLQAHEGGHDSVDTTTAAPGVEEGARLAFGHADRPTISAQACAVDEVEAPALGYAPSRAEIDVESQADHRCVPVPRSTTGGEVGVALGGGDGRRRPRRRGR